MPKSKSNNSNKSRDPVSANKPKIVKGGMYDGSHPSTDFIVSGHSTGSPNSEMEALSHQVSRDAGEVPAYPTDDNYRIQKTSTDIGSKMPEDYRDTSDLAGPEMYGPRPTLLKQKSLEQMQGSKRFGLWSSIGLIGAALAGFAAYKVYTNPELRRSLIST